MSAELKEFADLVGRMRRAQRDFFDKSNNQHVREHALKESKFLERRVDETLRQIQAGQKVMF